MGEGSTVQVYNVTLGTSGGGKGVEVRNITLHFCTNVSCNLIMYNFTKTLYPSVSLCF